MQKQFNKEFDNKILKSNLSTILDNNYSFEKGNVSGFSIEVYEPETDSFSSFLYYNDEESRDKDYGLLCQSR